MAAILNLAPAAFDLIDRLQAAASIDAAWAIYMGAAGDVGFEFGAAARFSRERDVSQSVFADAMPPGWLRHYAAQGYQRQSPIMQRGDAPVAFTWRMSDWDGVLNTQQRRWREDNLGAGISHGFNIPDRSDGELKVISLCGDGPHVAPHDLMVLKFAGFELFARLRELGLGGSPPPAKPLSGREAECLTWVACGKSDWEIGEILGLSQKTVNHHVERAKLKLRAATRLQAVVAALRQDIIHI